MWSWGPSIGPKTCRPPLSARRQDGARPDQGRSDGAFGADQGAPHHPGNHLRLAGSGTARLHATRIGGHARAAAGRRRGYTSAQAIAAAAPEKLCTDVINFALTTTGQRLLRQAEMPDLEKIKGWQETARSVQAAQLWAQPSPQGAFMAGRLLWWECLGAHAAPSARAARLSAPAPFAERAIKAATRPFKTCPARGGLRRTCATDPRADRR